MSVKYWGSPFPVESSLIEALHDAGIARQPWKSIDFINQSGELTILFDPPDLILSRRAAKTTTTNPNDLDLVDLSILYDEILTHANNESVNLIASWQLYAISQSLSLQDILSHHPGTSFSLNVTSIDYPEMNILSSLSAHYLNNQQNGKLFSLYYQVEELAIRFGRDVDRSYNSRLEKILDHHTIARTLREGFNNQQRESFLVNGLHQTQQEYRDYVLESKEILKQYQELLRESQCIASKYRDELAKSDAKVSPS